MATRDAQPPKHKPNEKHTLDEVLKSLNDLVRSNVLDKPTTPITKTPPVPRKPAATSSKADMGDILKSLENLLDNDLNPNDRPTAPKPAPLVASSPPPRREPAKTEPTKPIALEPIPAPISTKTKETTSAMSDVLSEADLVKALEEISFDTDVGITNTDTELQTITSMSTPESDSIVLEEKAPPESGSSVEIPIANLAQEKSSDVYSVDVPFDVDLTSSVSSDIALDTLDITPTPATDSLVFDEAALVEAEPVAEPPTAPVAHEKAADVQPTTIDFDDDVGTIETAIEAAPPPGDTGLEFSEDKISAAPSPSDNASGIDVVEAAPNTMSLVEELAAIDFSTDDLDPAPSRPSNDNFSIDFTPSKKSEPQPEPQPIADKTSIVEAEKTNAAVTVEEIEASLPVDMPTPDTAQTESELVDQSTTDDSTASSVVDDDSVGRTELSLATVGDGKDETDAAASVEEIEASLPVDTASPDIAQMASESADRSAADDSIAPPSTDDYSDIIERAEPPLAPVGGAKNDGLGSLGEFKELDFSGSDFDSVEFSTSALSEIDSEPATGSTPAPLTQNADVPKLDATTVDLDEKPSSPPTKAVVTPKPSSESKPKDIPVLKNVAVAPSAADFALEPSPPIRPATKKRESVSQDLYLTTVRAVAKLNIELKKSGKPPLDAKAINRLQQLLKEALEISKK